MAYLNESTVVCDACGRSRQAVLTHSGYDIPDNWRKDSRYDYCEQCGPLRIRTMEELEAELATATLGVKAN